MPDEAGRQLAHALAEEVTGEVDRLRAAGQAGREEA